MLALPGGALAPFGVAFDSTGDLFVGAVGVASIFEFAPGATGSATAIRTIAGAATGIAEPIALAVDGSGYLYVANAASGAVTVYGPAANGNAAPVRAIAGTNTTIGTTTNALQSLAVDAAGTVYAAVSNNGTGGAILVFPPGSNGNVAPSTAIAGAHTGIDGPIAVALDASVNLYAIDAQGSTVIVFAPGATGNATPARTFTATASIDDPGGIAVDGEGNVYVTSQMGGSGGSYSVFPAGSSGIGVPIYTVSGTNAPFDQAYGIAVY